jgi:hypothetical protein
MNLLSPEENENYLPEKNKQDPRKDVETVVSNNENIEPVPDEKQLEEKKKAKD